MLPVYRCPVPTCELCFVTLRLLSCHLDSMIRKNRCGAYTGAVLFICSCGESCTTIDDIKLHVTVHKYPPCTNVLHTEAENGGDLDNNSERERMLPMSEDDGVWDEAGVSFTENEEEDASDDDEAASTHADALLNVAELMFGGVVVDELKLHNFELALLLHPHMKLALDVFQFCVESRCTHKSYRSLRKIVMVEDNRSLPKNYKDLRKSVLRFLQENCNWLPQRVACINGLERVYSTPYMSVGDALTIWFALPPILSAVKTWNATYLPRDLVDLLQYEELYASRATSISDGHHLYSCVGDGSVYLKNVCDAVPLFRDNYNKAVAEGLEVFVINFGLYEDIFSKHLNSLVNQTVFCLTLGKQLCYVQYTLLVFISILLHLLSRSYYWRSISHWTVIIGSNACKRWWN
jgi:hypothetical protein